MLNALKKIWDFAGTEQNNIRKAVLLNFIYAVFYMMQIAAVYRIVTALTDGESGAAPAWEAFGLVLVSIAGMALIKTFSQLQQTHAGYFMAANRRIEIGERLKRVPMGYFNDNSLGELSGIATTTLENVEMTAPMVLINIFGGLINALVFTVMILLFDWRIGLLVVLGIALYLAVTSAMERKSVVAAPRRQRSESALVAAVLEYVQGMSVVKSFGLAGRGDCRLREALEENRRSNLAMEQLFTPYTMGQGFSVQLFGVLMMGAAVLFYLQGSMTVTNALMVVVISFLVFGQIESAGSGMSILRVVSSSIEQANSISEVPQMDEGGRERQPDSHEICLEDVRFSYEDREILHGITVRIPDRTTTAIVGPSGSGKTTLCSLIARFWDVDSGRITIGGEDVRGYTLASLMDQISMVFQNVYLFADTIENNIKFGRPQATHEEVVAAARAACCDDFIEALPDGYQTVIGEGGASLSGGERQRISIARAMLKDAPVIIFDEATANVDPENEDRLQRAIEALTRDKTILMIAHRLKTVQNADQILVVDGGCIVQQGSHEMLLQEPGLYADFVRGREKAAQWRMGKQFSQPDVTD
ncbi:MAG: ABC transporter ATP-binding protein [Eubacteriales bacterium]|nr:ABC transporter ATP-binding protein [Eubacteriales bacterium]